MKHKILLALALVLSGGLPSFAWSSLPWLASADAVSNLLDAIHAESDRKVKGQMLVALPQTGDQPGLERLLAIYMMQMALTVGEPSRRNGRRARSKHLYDQATRIRAGRRFRWRFVDAIQP